MKILWITNIIFPEAQFLLTGKEHPYVSGGWMIGAAEALTQLSDIELFVASLSSDVMKLTQKKGEKITYYYLPLGKGGIRVNHEYEPLWKELTKEIRPDVVHIHGTELSHGLAYVKACGNKNVVVSIQGLTSVIAKYYDYGLTRIDILSSITLRDIIRGSIYHEKKAFQRRGEYEIELLKRVNHIIGRTSWDKSHIWAINRNANYYFCNEILRKSFYEGEVWSYQNCNKYQIFVSQANYPIKGFHQLIKALPFVVKEFPDVIVRVAGGGKSHYSFKQRLAIPGYLHYLSKMIHKLSLDNHVVFLGMLNEQEMKKEYLSANLFLCPSSIENSPNSLCEAQILGVPVLATFAGGIPDLMAGCEKYLYRFEEIEMLANMICDIFRNSNSFDNKHERYIANARHNKEKNIEKLYSIYKLINDYN